MAREFKAAMDAKGMKFCIVASRYGRVITDRLVAGAIECIQQHGGRDTDVDIFWVPGSFEIPLIAKLRAKNGAYHAIIALGCVLRGETPHNEYIAGEVVKGLAHINLDTEIPTIFGVLTVDTMEQGIERAGMKGGGRGYEAAAVAIEMANLVDQAGRKSGSRKK